MRRDRTIVITLSLAATMALATSSCKEDGGGWECVVIEESPALTQKIGRREDFDKVASRLGTPKGILACDRSRRPGRLRVGQLPNHSMAPRSRAPAGS